MDLSRVFCGKKIKKLLNLLIKISKEKPGIMNELLDKIFVLIKEESTFEPGLLIHKNSFIAVVGLIRGEKFKFEDYFRKKSKGVSLKICDDLSKIKNGSISDSLRSERCVGIIWGQSPHSIMGNPQNQLAEKSVNAMVGSSLKLTISSFKEALNDLFEKINYSP